MDRAHVSKTLSWLLRHGAAEAGLHLDAAGWAPLADVLRITGVSRGDVEAAVRDNTKRRFELDGDRIRAVQGHSSTQVDLDALEASWERVVGRVEPLFHGTRLDVLDAVRREGLRPMSRTHVHLADAPDATVGKRAGVDVLLAVDPARLDQPLFRSPNGVLLTRAVPAAALTQVWPVSRAARAALGDAPVGIEVA